MSFPISSFVPGECLLSTKSRTVDLVNFAEQTLSPYSFEIPECDSCQSPYSYPVRCHFAKHTRLFVATESHSIWLGDFRDKSRKPLQLFDMKQGYDYLTFQSTSFHESVVCDPSFGELFASSIGPGPNCHTVSTESHILSIDQRMPNRIVQSWGHLLRSPIAYFSINELRGQKNLNQPNWILLGGTQFSSEVFASVVSHKEDRNWPIVEGFPWRISTIGSAENHLPSERLTSDMSNMFLHESPLSGLTMFEQSLKHFNTFTVVQLTARGQLFYQLYSTENNFDDELEFSQTSQVSSPLDTIIERISPVSNLGKMMDDWVDQVLKLNPDVTLQINNDDNEEMEISNDSDFNTGFRPLIPSQTSPTIQGEEEREEITKDEFCVLCRQIQHVPNSGRNSPELATLSCSVCKISLDDARKCSSDYFHGNCSPFLLATTDSDDVEQGYEHVNRLLPIGDDLAKFQDSFSVIQRLLWESDELPFEQDEYEAALEARLPWCKRRMAQIVEFSLRKRENFEKNSSLLDTDDVATVTSDGSESDFVWNPEQTEEHLLSSITNFQQTFCQLSTNDLSDVEEELENVANNIDNRSRATTPDIEEREEANDLLVPSTSEEPLLDVAQTDEQSGDLPVQ